jgi:hypothetical protein
VIFLFGQTPFFIAEKARKIVEKPALNRVWFHLTNNSNWLFKFWFNRIKTRKPESDSIFVSNKNNMKQFFHILSLLIFLTFFFISCSVVGGIFQTGVSFGIFIAIVVVAGIIILITRSGKK